MLRLARWSAKAKALRNLSPFFEVEWSSDHDGEFLMGQILLAVAMVVTAVLLCCFFDAITHDDEDS